jgi:CHAT domain-containing protein
LLSFNQFRENTVELLTLSACQTAVGDERAALGLAGVAIKAGARSALASLWFVNDTATAELISEFYNQLRSTQLSKAQALQNAQKKLLDQKTFNHPIFWAPFLLIGNWL